MTTTMVHLRAAAETEAARVAGARALSHAGDEEMLARLEADGPWILVARRSALRRRLRRRALFIWQVACEDAGGRTVASQLCAVAVRLSACAQPRTRAWRRRYLCEIEAEVRARIDARVRQSIAPAVEAAQSFLMERLRREKAIAAHLAEVQSAPAAFQPGLFDGRAVRRHSESADAGAEIKRGAADRIAGLERSGALTVRAARLLLVVVP
jgi:hypothetical protein